MAKYTGLVGFGVSSETSPGVWIKTITEKRYNGDVISNRQRWSSNSSINESLTLNKSISIMSNSYLIENLPYILYVTYAGNKWKVTSVDLQHPRVILEIGGAYNENEN